MQSNYGVNRLILSFLSSALKYQRYSQLRPNCYCFNMQCLQQLPYRKGLWSPIKSYSYIHIFGNQSWLCLLPSLSHLLSLLYGASFFSNYETVFVILVVSSDSLSVLTSWFYVILPLGQHCSTPFLVLASRTLALIRYSRLTPVQKEGISAPNLEYSSLEIFLEKWGLMFIFMQNHPRYKE